MKERFFCSSPDSSAMRNGRLPVVFFLLFSILMLYPLGALQAAQEQPVQLHVRLLDANGGTVDQPLFGHNYTAFIDIQNTSRDLIVLRGVEMPQQLPDSMTWFGSFFGRLTFEGRDLPEGVVTDNATEPDHRAERWMWEPQVRQATPPILASAVLFPGERLAVLRQVALWDGGLAVEVTFNRLDKAEASRVVYLPMFADDDRLVVFKRVNLDVPDFERVRAAMKSSTAVIPDGDELPIQLAAAVVSFPLGEDAFPLEEALKRVDFPLKNSVYWDGGGGWVLKPVGDFGSVFVAEERIMLFPECDLLAFTLLDGLGEHVELVLPMAGYGTFGARMPSVDGRGVYDPGVTGMAVDQAVELLARARRLGDAVKPVLYAPHDLDKRLYAVVGDFDPEIRLNWAAGMYDYRVWREERSDGVGELFVLWPFGADAPEIFSSMDDLKARLDTPSEENQEVAMLVLGLGKNKDVAWVERTGFAGFCAAKEIRLTLKGNVSP